MVGGGVVAGGVVVDGFVVEGGVVVRGMVVPVPVVDPLPVFPVLDPVVPEVPAPPEVLESVPVPERPRVISVPSLRAAQPVINMVEPRRPIPTAIPNTLFNFIVTFLRHSTTSFKYDYGFNCAPGVPSPAANNIGAAALWLTHPAFRLSRDPHNRPVVEETAVALVEDMGPSEIHANSRSLSSLCVPVRVECSRDFAHAGVGSCPNV